jgi:hypothetical protein
MKVANAVGCALPAPFDEGGEISGLRSSSPFAKGGDDGAAASNAFVVRNACEFEVVGVCFQSGRKPRLANDCNG